MKVYYSSMYFRGNINNFEELINKIDPQKIQLYLDTNICVYLRDFYREPNAIVKRDDGTWDELKVFLKNIEQYDLIVDYSLGAEEASRALNNFEINYEKLNEIYSNISKLFNMSYFDILEHSKLIKCKSPARDKTVRQQSKMDSLEAISRFKNLLYINYACLLKLYILEKNPDGRDRVNQMITYIDFLDKEIDLISATDLIFGYHFFSGNSKIKGIIHPTKKTIEYRIHALWNSAIDLTFPTLVSRNFAKDNTIPVFVTCDEKLWTIFNSMKIRVIFTENVNIDAPPILEIDESSFNWIKEELKIVDEYFDTVQDRRRNKFIYKTLNIEEYLEKLQHMCLNLENEAKEFM